MNRPGSQSTSAAGARTGIDRFREDVELLTAMQERMLEEAGAGDVLSTANQLLAAVDESGFDPGRLGPVAESLSADELELVAKALTVHFHLVNLADERHSVRTFLAGEDGGGEDGSWPSLSAGEVDLESLHRLRVHPVLTAHPTEARRRAVASALRRIGHQLDRYDDPQRGEPEREVAMRRLREELEVLWRTAYLRTTRPTPYDEVRTAMGVFDDTLLRAVPRLYRSAEKALGGSDPGVSAPVVPAFVRFGSWIGGDRDGNPYVTADVTRQTLGIQAQQALRALVAAVDRVGRTLTLDATSTPPSRELRDALARAAVVDPERAEGISRGVTRRAAPPAHAARG